MRIAKKRAHAPSVKPDALSEVGLGDALVQALGLPLSALRVSMEALAGELGERETGPKLPLVLDEVGRLSRSVSDLIAYASPAQPLPLRCTLEEITQGARSELPEALRSRVVEARHDRGVGVVVDGPMISLCLRRLMENSFEAGAEGVLLVSRHQNGYAAFSVVDTAPEAFESDWAVQPFHTKRPNHLGLGLALVRRDVEMMGGRLHMASSSHGSTCIELSIPEGRPSERRSGVQA